MQQADEIEEGLAEFALTARPPEAARAMMRLALFDWALCALAGSAEPLGTVMRAHAAGQGGAGEASAVGLAQRLPARLAALVNGTISHALDYDDTHFDHIGHLSVVAVPVALALAERGGRSMAEMLEAAALAEEAAVRIGLWLGRAHYQAGFHQTATAGALGAALGAARLLGLDRAATRHALNIAAGSAAGLKAQFGSQAKPLNAGLAAACALEAALLAAAGLAATPGALAGAQGFGATHAGEGRAEAFAPPEGGAWRIERLSFKFHACCHGLHATLEALDAALRDLSVASPGAPLSPDMLDRLEVRAHPRWESVCNLPAPADALQCKFSFAHVAAMRMSGQDTARPQSYSDAAARDPRLGALSRKVRVRFDPAIPETGAALALHLSDGRSFRARHDIAAPRAPEALRQRLRAKARALLGAETAEALWRETAETAPLDALTARLRAG